MLSLSPIAGGGSRYYLGKEGEGKTNYYLDEHIKSYWGGGAKDTLGLKDGPIEKEDFDRLMAGVKPDGQRIGRMRDGKLEHDPGRDLTFSDPKSVSTLMQGPLRPKVMNIRRMAVEKAMAQLEKLYAKTRISGKVVGNQKIVWAAVNEDTSRANDPNTHIHVVLFNMVQGQDGQFRAMDNTLIYDHQILLGQIYRSEVAKGIKELGFELEPAGKHGQWELKDIPVEVRESFSKRRQAILEKIDPNNDTAQARENICLITRPSKQNLMREELKHEWGKELAEHGTSFEQLSQPLSKVPTKAPYSIADRVKLSMEVVAETNSHMEVHKFHQEVMDRTHGHFTIDQIKDEIVRQIDKGYMIRSEDGGYLARAVDIRREKLVTEELQKGHLKSKPLLSKTQLMATVDGTFLKDDQKAAIKLFTRSNSRYVKIQGDAGTGKTTALKTAIPAIKAVRARGYKVIGLSTTGASTQELADTKVFDKVMTLQRYLMVPEGDKKTILVVDESSMIGRDQMLSLTRFTNKKQMPRVVFQGDGNQMSGVQAGEPFKKLEKAGVRSVILNQIIRQRDERHRDGISHLARGELNEAFKTLAPEIHEISADKMMDHTIKAWRETGNAKTPIIIQTNKQKNEINQTIKSEQLKSNPNAKSITIKTWQPVHKSETEKRLVETFKDVSHIRFNNNYKRLGVKRGDIFKIEAIHPNKASISISRNGKQREFRPARMKLGKGALELYNQEERTLHEGDRIRFTRGGHRQPVKNNDYGTVKSINGDKVTFELDRNKTLSLSPKDKNIRHIDHAWASTTHAFQGKTVDHAVVHIPSRKSPLTTLQSLYTSASRHRLSLTIVTDNAPRLQRNIEKAANLQKLEANLRWPEQEAVKAIEVMKPKEIQAEPSKNKPLSTPKEKAKPTFSEPTIAKNIISNIQRERERQKELNPQRERTREISRGGRGR